jgi:hypothetical protein
MNGQGKRIAYLLNYSSNPQTFQSPFKGGVDLTTGQAVGSAALTLKPWDLAIVEEP